MRLAITAAVASSLLALVAAQAGLPECAQKCAAPAIPANCGLDPECICTAKTFIEAITCCVAKNCSKDEQEKTITIAKQTCAAVGVNDLPDAAVCDGASSSSATSSPSSSAAPPTGTGTAPGTGTTPSPTAEPTESGAGTKPSGSPTGTGTGTPPPAATETPGAGSRVGVATGMGVAVGLVMGALGMI